MEEEAGKAGGGIVETRAETDTSGPEVVRFWREQLRMAGEEEKKWREAALDAVRTYEGDEAQDRQRFNILYSNMETLAPSVYNSAPIPDVRRRFNEGSPTDLVASQSIERAVSYFLDTYGFDEEMNPTVLDGLLVGRGVARVRMEPQMDDFGGVAGIEVYSEHVHWEDYRQSPAGQWRDVRWVAYRHLFTREQLVRLNPEIGGQVELGVSVDGKEKDGQPKNVPDIYKRSETWEIWDRERREVLFISNDWPDAPIAQVPDPYGLKGFWPQPKPYYDVMSSTSLKPVCPYALYKAQARELDKVTRRIMSLAAVVKMTGAVAGQADFIAKLQAAEDGTLVPISDIDMQGVLSSGSGDLSKLIWLWPIEKTVAVLRELIGYRETIKATIYEITGISDIIRGNTDPNETLGAQQIKAQWGSLRLQRRQKDVQRLCRDLVRLQAELIAEKMPVEQLAMVTNIQLPSAQEKMQAQQQMMMIQQAGQQAQQMGAQIPPEMQAQAQQAMQQAGEVLAKPTWDEVSALLKSDAMRCYRVDIETDSTIREDVTRAQQNIAQFVQSIGQLIQGALPVMQAKPDFIPVVLETLKATARTFKLGRGLEEAIEKVGPQIAPAQPPAPPPEDPREARAAEEQEAERGRQHEGQMQAMLGDQQMQAAAMRAQPSAPPGMM